MDIVTPTSRLEAVNLMMRAIGEAPVTQLQKGTGVDTPEAVATLDDTLRAVQSEGWEFNTEDNYPLPRDEGGHVYVPRNSLRLTYNEDPSIHPVTRGNRVYDRKNHTYKFDKTLYATIIVGLPFEEMPESGRKYVAIRAARWLQDNTIGEAVLHRFSQEDEQWARIAFVSDQTEVEGNNMLRDTPDFRRHVVATTPGGR